MSLYDNEIYRGPPEPGPTLEHDIRSYGSDVYIVKSPKATLEQDIPATEEPARQESSPVQKKESKIAKAMKLLASCTAAMTIATTLIGAPTQGTVQADLQEWPQFSQVSTDSGLAFRTVSKNSNVCQVSVGGWAFRFEALQEGIHMGWHESYDYYLDGDRGGFYMNVQNTAEDWDIMLDCSLTPHDRVDPEEALGTIKTSGGPELYIRSFFLGGTEKSPEQLQSIIDSLSSYVRIVNATEDGWGKVFIGETILSDTNLQWNGRMTVSSDFWSINRIHYASDHGFVASEASVQRDINGIHWGFFCGSSQSGDPVIWAVPSHDDLALGIDPGYLPQLIGFDQAMLEEDPYILEANLDVIADLLLDTGLCYYHLADSSGWDPVPVVPVSPTPSITPDSEPDILPDDPYGEEYFRSLPFSFEGRTFQLNAVRDDVSLRQIYQGEDHTQFDLRIDGENVRVQLIVGSSPNGAEYYPYTLSNGLDVYAAVFNYWGEPWIHSTDTLFSLIQNISSYIQITETTEPVLPEPYPEMAEYVQYHVASGFPVTSPYARSNRTCQFVTEYNAYRLRAQIPELFIHWEDYYYDVKEEMANSLISFNHYEEDWTIYTWVFEDQVESMYEGIPLTMADGTQLWFYVDNYRSTMEEDQLQAILDRLPSLVTLSQARDDGWGKVRIGETLISNVNRYWNGLAYTVGDYDFWYFEQFLSSEDASIYDLRYAGVRNVNGIAWEFYTSGSPSGYVFDDGSQYYHTRLYAKPSQEDIYLAVTLSGGLALPESEFRSQEAYETCVDENIAFMIDIVVSQGLSNFYLYP